MNHPIKYLFGVGLGQVESIHELRLKVLNDVADALVFAQVELLQALD